MKFFRFTGHINSVNESKVFADDRDEQKQAREAIGEAAEKYNDLFADRYFFVEQIQQFGKEVSVGVLAGCENITSADISAFLEHLGIFATDITGEETVFRKIENMLFVANRAGLADDPSETFDSFGLEVFSRRGFEHFKFVEDLTKDIGKDEIYRRASEILSNDTLIAELDRIYAGKAKNGIAGHPVHYMLEIDNDDLTGETLELLMSALYENKRLENRRYTMVDFDEITHRDEETINKVYRNSLGGAVVFTTISLPFTETNVAYGNVNAVDKISSFLKEYSKDVLTVICLPRECKGVRERYFEHLENQTVIEIKEERVSREREIAFLKKLAKEDNVRTTKKLFEQLEDDKTYLADDLHRIYDRWYSERLKNEAYPQYCDIKAIVKEKHRGEATGDAYAELQKLVGLERTKQVVNRVINYTKAQTLFAGRGMKKENQSLHMVFTGNPGTAKTTVARLFAQIMRDNGVLAHGNFVEVGRSDLVGTYVGWTAKCVKKAFDKARGGVLFIDEAYSLVDDRDGSFGDEAINTIVQEMENNRQDVIVIFAGYPDKMQAFLAKNPGLRSRIAYHVPFDDYDTDALCKIAKVMAEQKGLKLTDGAMQRLRGIFDVARTGSDFGNGRFVRNMLENAKMLQASRLVEADYDKIDDEDVVTIIEDDIEMPVCFEEKKTVKLGFAS